MATVRILRGMVETRSGDRPESVDIPLDSDDRIITFGISGGYARSNTKPVQWNWWAYVTKEN